MDRRVMILSASIGSGHNSAAGALQTSLRNRMDVAQVRFIDIMTSAPELYRTLYDDGYFKLVDSLPWLVSWGYDRQDPPFKFGRLLTMWDRLNTTSAVREIRAYHPELILCTHFLPARLISLLQARGAISTRLGVITTDYDFQGMWLSTNFSRLFVARAETVSYLAALGIPADRMTVSGIPVRPELSRPVDRQQVLCKFGLRPDLPIVLVSAGAAGGGYAKTVVRQLLAEAPPCQVVVVCGRNEELRAEIESLIAGRSEVFLVLGYTTELPDLMRVASLFVGKPGGLSAAECMAAGLPMVLINPIPGQEVRNSDYLLEQGAAVRCNYDATIGWKIGKLLADPAKLAQMAAAAQQTGRPDAAGDIADQMLTDRGGPLWISHSAQRSLLAASERGQSASDLDPGKRVRTLTDSETGQSRALITEDQRGRLLRVTGASRRPGSAQLVLERSKLTRLRTLRADPPLSLTVQRILGGRQRVVLDVR